MASFNDNRRGEGPKRRGDETRRRRQSVLDMESLEQRRLLTWNPTSPNPLDAVNGPLANLGSFTVKAYGEYLAYEAAGAKGAFKSSLSNQINFNGTSIGLDVRGIGDLTTYKNAVVSLGMVVTATVPSIDLLEGYFPLAKLPQLASEAQTVGAQPIYKPHTNQQGISPNQGDNALNAPAARTAFGVDGTGQKLGVLSDSVSNLLQGKGLALQSQATGDLGPVQVIQDLAPVQNADGSLTYTGTDEGRAMLEQIHDIAPGASLAFATAFTGPAGFGANIEALNAAGATTIVDDVGYLDDPYYQDGIIQASVNKVVANGATYLSSVGNTSDSGYESAFRGVTATVGSLGSGTYMNFDPTGATTTTQLGINVYTAGTAVALQFDQPFYTANGVTSSVEIDILNAAGTLVSQANQNNIATQTPFQASAPLAAGLYTVVIKVDSGPNPGHVFFYASGDGGFSVDTKFGAAGSTFYPSTFGHNAGGNTISVGAVPFFGTNAYPHTPAGNTSEPFSSTGPVLHEFNFDGSPASPTILLKPDISSPDGNNTSFFGFPADTTNPPFPASPPYPGDPVTTFAEPKTATNQSVSSLLNFFGTSSAAPNLAAVVALMKQSNPSLGRAQILQNLTSTATPLNGQTKGVWNTQAGYGLADALAALSAVQTLKVVSIVPGSGGTTTSIPTFLRVTFNQPIDGRTISAANLQVAGPNGAIVTVTGALGVDDPVFPSVVDFPITITPAGTNSANGVYHDAILGGPLRSENGQPLSALFLDQFNLQRLQGPQVIATAFQGRVVTIQFSEALNPATINPANIFLFRNGGVNNPNLGPASVIVSQLPGAKFSYNAATYTVTIDLTGVSQSSLPTDRYGLFVRNSVTDGVNNPLNGAFTGVFPSGTNPPTVAGSAFYQDLGVVTLKAPIITTLVLAPISDSGIAGDNNTNIQTPSLVGQVTANFPATVSNVLIYAEFNGISHAGVAAGGLDLAVSASGRGFIGHYDVQTTTNALGQFVINYPAGVTPLPDGQNRVRVVVVGAPDQPPFPGLSSAQDTSFRVDTTLPIVAPPIGGGSISSIPQNATINNLSTLTINVADPVSPQQIGSPFAVDPRLAIPALNPGTASNVQNYRLFRVSGPNLIDESSFITSAAFVSTSARVLSSDPYTGQVNLTFAPGLPAGVYTFMVLSSAYGSGLSDAAGNPFNGGSNGTLDYTLNFTLQPTPTFITSYVAYTPDAATPGGLDTSGVRSTYELPVSGIAPRAAAPPTLFTIDFSNSLNPNTNYSQALELVRSADSNGALPDGNFGDLGITNTSGFTVVSGINVGLTNSVLGAVAGQYGYHNRLLISLPAGFTLPADYYRLYIPNNSSAPITDIFGNQLDGEFLGYQNSGGKYVDQLQNGQVRGSGVSELPDLSGDGNAGGAFMTGFVVVPNGNVIYAAADAIYNPQIPSQTPDGSVARPYPVLAPEAVPNAVNGGDLNSAVNAGTNFNPTYDRSGDGRFEPSAIFAAQQRLQATGGPVVILAEASLPSRDLATGAVVQKPFVLEAPAPSGGQSATIANDASTSLPALTTLVFQAGSALKMQNAALLVQNQGSALQVLGGPNPTQSVIVTSYKDSSVGGATNGDPNSTPLPGDYGGIVFRSYSQAALPGQTVARGDLFPGQVPITGDPTVDNRLKGQFTNLLDPASQADAIAGADDIMSSIQFLTEKYAGGAVPQTVGVRYDGITLLNSRPAIVNTILAQAGGAGSAQAGLSVDVDALRSDDVAQGPLVRNDQFLNDGLNGIYIRANVASGVAEATDAVSYPNNPTTQGGQSNFVLNNPYPYLLTSKLEVGQRLAYESGAQSDSTDRLYIIPGMLVKFERGAYIEVGQQQQDFIDGQGTAASLVVGDPTYAREYDVNHLFGPATAGFKANSSQLAKVLFTSFNDDAATTFYTDPVTQVVTTIVQPLPALPTSGQTPAPAKGDWGGIQVDAGARATINSANFNYGGGLINTQVGSNTIHAIEVSPSDGQGAFLSITNNTFLANADVPINLSPNSLLATDPTRPLNSGAPFIHGNLFVGNDYNGVGVNGGTAPRNVVLNASNLDFNSVWSGSDFTYFLRKTIVLGPQASRGVLPTPSATVLQAIPTPNVTLTLQSTLPGTVLADGTAVSAPGVPLVIKLLTADGFGPPAETEGQVPTAAIRNSVLQGAGFVVGIDNGIDPTADPVLDTGAFSELRIVGIAANQTTGQSRVPVIITSAHDNTVGTTVNGVSLNQLIPGDATAPKSGDGGVIYFGANSMTSYNLLDPRSGSIIDNADISYITRIEQQGGGLVYGFALDGGTALTRDYNTLFGLPQGGGVNFADQYNAPKSITLSNSNFSTFSDVGFYAHPGYGALLIPVNYTQTGIVHAGNYLGEPTHDFFVNNTFSNMPTAVEILSENAPDIGPPGGPYVAPAMAVFLNNTFYNNNIAIHTIAPVATGTNFYSHVAMLAMDNIFLNSKTSAVVTDGQNYGGLQNQGDNDSQIIIPSQLQYNDFFGNTANVTGTGSGGGGGAIAQNSQAFFTDPGIRNPAAGNFFLKPTSSVIDSARSEIGPTIFGDMLYPADTVDPNNLSAVPIRNAPVFDPTTFGLDQTKPAGDVNVAGGLGYFGGGPSGVPYYQDIVTLPGRLYSGTSTGAKQINFPDQWIATLQADPAGSTGTSKSPAVYAYKPITGQRDQVGNLRGRDPNVVAKGFGSIPFFDLGAFEYIIQNPPVVEAVTATTTVGVSNLYGVGTIAGTNQLPSKIQFLISERLDPNTISGMSVIFQASGGDGIFGNNNSPADRSINLSGKLSFDNATDILTIDTSGLFGATLAANDEYRIILKGTGSSVIRDNSGLALDGFNLDSSGNQLPLPSGSDQFPGSDFQVTFTIDTSAPSVVAGSFRLDPASDSSGGLSITKVKNPTFDGTVTDVFPPTTFLQGQSVHIDISTKGDGVFDLLDAGIGVTDASGNFRVTLTKPIPDTPNKVGYNGIQESPGSSLTYARVRVIDQAGNQSSLVTDPIQSYAAKLALTGFQEDTVLPKVSAFSPLSNSVAMANANGQVVITVTFTKNIKLSTLNANSILVQRSGGTGNFTTPIAVPIVPNSLTFTLSAAPATLGYETVTFAIAASLPNDQYRVVLKGTGASPITDLATNPLDGANTGTGSDFINTPFVLYSSSSAHLIYVAAPGSSGAGTGTGTQGTRQNPFTTIAAGLKAALIGDDVLVLPGTYQENVTMKAGVRLLSAGVLSTDTTFTAGSPLATLIYGVPSATNTSLTGNNITTVNISGATVGIPTEVSGFSIISPLLGDSNLGIIDTTDVAVRAVNTNAQIDRNIIVNAGTGIFLGTGGVNAPTASVFDNLIAGNVNGIGITDNGNTVSTQAPFMIVNNTIVDNTIGLYNTSLTFGTTQAYVINNIFFSNHDLTSKRAGTGISSLRPNTLAVGNNLFYQNGPTNAASSNATGTFIGFNPASLSTKPDAFGNILANPFFASAEDPRPNADTPSVFFNYGNFDLTSRSLAINAADNGLAPASDILYRTPVAITGHGFPGTGPASIGAYYFGGKTGASGGSGTQFSGTGVTGTGTTGTTKIGTVSALAVPSKWTVTDSTIGGGIATGSKVFSVLTTSLASDGSAHAADATGLLYTQPGPKFIDVNFSDDINASSLSASDLGLAGSGLDAANPARATSLAWIDDHAVRFFLSGGYNASGTVSVTLPQGAITDTAGAPLAGFSDAFRLGSAPVAAPVPTPAAPPSPVGATAAVTPSTLISNVLPVIQPVAAAAPVAVLPPTSSAPSGHKLTAKEQKQQAAQAKAAKAAQAKAEKAAKAEAQKVAKHAAQVAKVALKASKTK